MQAQIFLKFNYPDAPLSEQHLVDCVQKDETKCYAYFPAGAYKFVIENGYLLLRDYYEYKAAKQECPPNNASLSIPGYFRNLTQLFNGNETYLKTLVATYGPVSVVTYLTNGFYSYDGGYFYDEECSSSKSVHAVAIWGYGSDGPGQDYWIIRNSWGPRWGENGYMKLARNKDNHCDIASIISFIHI